MSYKGKTPHYYDQSSRSFHQGAWKNWPNFQRDRNGRSWFPYALMKRDEELLLRRERRQQFVADAPTFQFNGRKSTKFLKDVSHET